MRVKVVVFDFEGVLVDSNAIKHNAYFNVFASLIATKSIVKMALEKAQGSDRCSNVIYLEIIANYYDSEGVRSAF